MGVAYDPPVCLAVSIRDKCKQLACPYSSHPTDPDPVSVSRLLLNRLFVLIWMRNSVSYVGHRFPQRSSSLCGTTANLAKLARSASVRFASSGSCCATAESCLTLSRQQPAGFRVSDGLLRMGTLFWRTTFRLMLLAGSPDSYCVKFSLWNLFNHGDSELLLWFVFWLRSILGNFNTCSAVRFTETHLLWTVHTFIPCCDLTWTAEDRWWRLQPVVQQGRQ